MNLRVGFNTNISSLGQEPKFELIAQQRKKSPLKRADYVSYKQIDTAFAKTRAINDEKEADAAAARDDTLYIHPLKNDSKFSALVIAPESNNTRHTYTSFMHYRSAASKAYVRALQPLTLALWMRVAGKNTPIGDELREALGDLKEIVNNAYAARSMLEQFRNAPFYDKKNDTEYQKQYDYISNLISKAEDARDYLNGLKF